MKKLLIELFKSTIKKLIAIEIHSLIKIILFE